MRSSEDQKDDFDVDIKKATKKRRSKTVTKGKNEKITNKKTYANTVKKKDAVFHDDKMFMNLWKDDNASHGTYISEKQIEEKMSSW